MERIVINNIEDYRKTQHHIEDLLTGEVSKSKLVTLARSLFGGEDQKANVETLRACILTEAGVRFKDTSLIKEGIRIWEAATPLCSAESSYNLGSGHLHLWQFAVKQNGLGSAWINERIHLHEARRLFKKVAEDERVELELRLKALTDCGNSFDIVGRYLDALSCYDLAISLDPAFGMAAGNRGITLLKVFRYMQGHESHVLHQAATDLDVAAEDKERVLRNGGQSALDIFERERARLSVSNDPNHQTSRSTSKFDDPYLSWCLHKGLFLHFSHECIRTENRFLDSVSFGSFRLDLSNDQVMERANELIDAFNSIKQDYVTARYLVWLATETNPIREQAEDNSKRTVFWDTLKYAQWGVMPGIGVQALKIALDTLDAIAAFVHLYLSSGRSPQSVDFRTLPYTNRNGKNLVPSFLSALEHPKSNWGLAALIDLSGEFDKERTSRLEALTRRRNAATHRFSVVHLFGVHESSSWTERTSWSELTQDSLEALQITRAAILNLAQMIQIHEEVNEESNPQSSLPLPFEPFDAAF